MQTRNSTSVLFGTSYSRFTFYLGVFLVVLVACCQTTRGALVAYWNFDEPSGTTVLDTAGELTRTNNGNFGGAGSTAPNRVAGRLGGALSFAWAGAPGSGGQLVTVPYHTNLALNGPFTVSFWYRPDVPFPAGTFPGIMRLGSQGNSPPGYGWGFFRQNNMVFKRGNVQPGTFPAMNFGQWNHLAVRYDGVLASSNTLYFLNGVQLNPFVATNGWTNVSATTVFEMGRMDAWDTATLDDLALWGNEAIAPARIRSLYTVPTSLFLDYNLANMRVLWSTLDGGPGTSNVVKGLTWSYTSTLPGSTNLGDAYLSGSSFYVVLSNGVGVTAPLTFISGPFSPGGVGTISTLALTASLTLSNAALVFDVNTGTNDLINIIGDLNITNSTVAIDPFTTLPPGTYRLVNYTGTKTGSLSVSNTTRYSLTLDEATQGQINLVVSGSPAALRWNSAGSGLWDLTSSNWFNLGSSATDRFFQGDSVLFDESGSFQTNITNSDAVFPNAITVNSSSSRNYNFTGVGQIGGVGNGVTKDGSSSLTLGLASTMVGDVRINAGILRLGSSTALGTTNGQTIIAAGATLDLVGLNQPTESVTVQGAGVGGGGAIINTGGALSNNGLRNRVTLLGDTTFGGNVRWDIINGRLEGNGFKLTKVGTSEIALINLGDPGLGDIDILTGILTFQGNIGMGDPAKTVTVNTNAVLAFWANGASIMNKPVVMNSAIMRNATSGNTDVTTNLGSITINGDAQFQGGANLALLGVVSGPGNVIKASGGVLYLGGANIYSGRTTVSNGRIALLAGSSIATSPRVEVLGGTVFDVTRLASGYPVPSGQTLVGSGSVHGSLLVPSGGAVLPGVENVAANLTVTNGLALSGGTLTFDLAAATTEGAGVNDLINVGGNLDLTGVSSIIVNPLGLLATNSTYTLINYTGALNGAEANLTVSNNTRYTFSISLATTNKVLLTVTGGAAADLFWFGDTLGAETLWDLQTTPNWSDILGSSSRFFGGDKVSFDDSALTNVITLVGSLTPASINVANGGAEVFGLDYIFQGSGKLSGNSSLTKVLGGSLTIANTSVNDYVGATTIDGGTLRVGTGGTFGNLGSGPITNNATLIFNRSDTLTLPNALAGSGNLIKSNANVMVLPTANPNYSGTLTAIGGTIRPGAVNALGNAVGGTVIASGATLDINAINLGDEPVTVGGAGVGGNGAIINASATGQNNALRFVTLTANTTFGGAGRWDIRTNGLAPLNATLSMGGNGYSLTKVGANQVSLVDVAVDPTLADINVNAGTFSAEIGTAAGDPTKTVTVANNAVLQFFNRTVDWNKIHVLNGGQNIFNNSGATVLNGPVTLNAAVTFNVAGTSLTVNSNIIGPGALTKTGTGLLILGSDNTYPGATTISAGTLQLGTATNAGWVAGPIAVGGNTLTVLRSDTVTMSNTLTGTGTLNVRTPGGLIIGTNTVNFGLINIGLNTPGRLVLQPGFTGSIGSFSIGESPGNAYGEVYQNGGTVTVSGAFRLGHWPNETSTYIMGGGSLTLTATPAGVVNQTGVGEQNGILYLGVDGTAIFIQTGGVARAHGIVLDARGATAGIDTFALERGQFIVGPSGIKSGSLDANPPTTYSIQLGGGTLSSSASWTSVLAMTFTGTNGNTTIDTAGNTNVLLGALSGSGGFTKIGAGVLVVSNGTYQGGTVVTQGTLVVRGTLGSGGGSVTVQGGTLAGDGTVTDAVVVQSGGALAPGLSIGKLTVNNSVDLFGTTVMEIAKSGPNLTNDLLSASASIFYGGTLTVIASGDPLAAGDTFKLFDGQVNGSFTSFNLPTLASNLVWNTSRLATDGTIQVGASSGPRLSLSLSGGTLNLSWPDGFSDFSLQAQTNAPGIGITTNWITLTNINTNSISFPKDTNNGSVFYRLLRP